MDEDTIYICTPGEYVVVRGSGSTSTFSGTLCIVDGIKKAKLQLTVLPAASNCKLLVTPLDIIDSGEYGDEDSERSDELETAYRDFNSGRGDVVRREDNQSSRISAGEQVHIIEKFDMSIKYYYEGQFQQSLESFVQVADQATNARMRAQAHLWISRCCQASGNTEGAHQYLTHCLSVDSSSVLALCCMGELLQNTDRPNEALSWYNRAADVDSTNPLPQFSIARLLFAAGPSGHPEAKERIIICVSRCQQTGKDALPEEVIQMYISAAELLGTLGCNAELQVRALLRAVNIVRNCGALDGPRTAPVFGSKAIVKELQNVQVRLRAAEAFFALGKLLQNLRHGESASGGNPDAATGTGIHTTGGNVGCGYMRGAFAAYYICDMLCEGSNKLYRSALNAVRQFGPI